MDIWSCYFSSKIIVDGVSIVASFIGSLSLDSFLLIVFAITIITAGVISYYRGFFDSLEQNYENAQIVDQKAFFQQLDEHKGEAASIEQKITFFDPYLNKEVTNLINEENIEENKISSMNIFINDIITLVSKAKNGGENACQKNYNLYGGSCACLNFKYNKENHKIILTFSFYDKKLFEYLIPLLKMINKKGYHLQKDNYEEDFIKFDIDADTVNVYKMIIINL